MQGMPFLRQSADGYVTGRRMVRCGRIGRGWIGRGWIGRGWIGCGRIGRWWCGIVGIIWAGALGKVLLAYTDEETVRREIAKLTPITRGTITDEAVFLKDLELTRNREYAISRGEREDGILSIAVPIFDWQGRVAYAFSLAGPALRFTEEKAVSLIPELQQLCVEISRKLFA